MPGNLNLNYGEFQFEEKELPIEVVQPLMAERVIAPREIRNPGISILDFDFFC
jgi:hypothetical protein